eukprot:m.517781 g.517781  ORF g.517781 m.517781 type:complete len:353 (-) comp57481_c1_seq15:707-1765(-)
MDEQDSPLEASIQPCRGMEVVLVQPRSEVAVGGVVWVWPAPQTVSATQAPPAFLYFPLGQLSSYAQPSSLLQPAATSSVGQLRSWRRHAVHGDPQAVSHEAPAPARSQVGAVARALKSGKKDKDDQHGVLRPRINGNEIKQTCGGAEQNCAQHGGQEARHLLHCSLVCSTTEQNRAGRSDGETQCREGRGEWCSVHVAVVRMRLGQVRRRRTSGLAGARPVLTQACASGAAESAKTGGNSLCVCGSQGDHQGRGLRFGEAGAGSHTRANRACGRKTSQQAVAAVAHTAKRITHASASGRNEKSQAGGSRRRVAVAGAVLLAARCLVHSSTKGCCGWRTVKRRRQSRQGALCE